MKIKMNASEYWRLINEERDQIEKYCGKPLDQVIVRDFHKYLIEKHPDKVEVIHQ